MEIKIVKQKVNNENIIANCKANFLCTITQKDLENNEIVQQKDNNENK